MRTHLVAYLSTALVMAGFDAIWLKVMSGYLYRPQLGDLLLDSFNPVPAVAFYLLYVAGILIFAVSPAFDSGRWTTALINGALFGFFAYATYDLTNQATLRGWSPIVTIVDLCWGTFLTAAAATLGYLISNAILKAMNS